MSEASAHNWRGWYCARWKWRLRTSCLVALIFPPALMCCHRYFACSVAMSITSSGKYRFSFRSESQTFGMQHFFESISLSLLPSLPPFLSGQESWVCSVGTSVGWATLLPSPPHLSFLQPSPSHNKSDLRSSVIQNTDTIWSATHSQCIQFHENFKSSHIKY